MRILAVLALYGLALSVALGRLGFRSRFAGPRAAPGRGSTGEVPADAARAMRVLIVGASGGTGRELVAQALERGHFVTAFVRDPARLRIAQHERLTVIRGDVMDAESVDAAVRGQDAVISALGHRSYYSPKRILSEGTRNLLRAMESHGTRRFVCETALGLGDSAGRMGLYYTLFVIPVVLPLYYWDKLRQERLIAASRTSWVIVRPGPLTNGPKRGVRRHGKGVGSYIYTPGIPRADVASFMLDQLASDTYGGAAPGVV